MQKLKTAKKSRPFSFHITKRASVPLWYAWLIRFLAFFGAAAFVALFVYLLFDIGPGDLYKTMFKGAFSGKNYLVPTLKTSAKLLCLAVALAPAFKMRFWNIGAEGQMLAGAMAAAFVMHEYASLPNWLLMILMCVTSVIAGGVWALIPAAFKVKFGTNETLFTLMMNYIAAKVVDYFYNIWRGARSSLGMINGNALQKDIYEKGYLRYFWSGENNSVWYKSEDIWYIAIIAAIAVFMYIYLKKTKRGYEIAVVGDSENTARYAGINVKSVVVRTMILSGVICGLGGFMTVSFQTHSVSSEIAGGYGFTAIIVAWMARMNTLFMMGVSVMVVALENGSQAVANAYSTTTGFPSSAAAVIMAVFLLFIIGSEFFINYALHFRQKTAKEEG